MSIDSLTIVSPRVNPIQYTSLSQVDVSGEVSSLNLDRIEVSNLDTPLVAALVATITTDSGDASQHTWEVTGLLVESLGINTIQVKAFDTNDVEVIETVEIHVDYTAPSIVEIRPTGNNITLDETIQVEFSEAMEDNITSHITISPIVADGYWEANIDKTICEYIHVTPLDNSITYTITVDALCKDAAGSMTGEDVYGSAGNTIVNGAMHEFSTGDYLSPHIIEISPAGENIIVSTAIQVVFSKTMEDDILSHVSIMPTVRDGYWTVNPEKTICEYVHTKGLDNVTTYTVTVDSLCKDASINENIISESVTHLFTTGDYYPPRIVEIFPNGNDATLNTAIQVVFNEPMEDNISSHISISPVVTSGYWAVNTNKTICEYIHTELLETMTTYTVTVDDLCQDAANNGNVLVDGARIHDFTTGVLLGGRSPTRLGLTPPQKIVKTGGILPPDSVLDVFSSFNKIVNPEVQNGYLTTQYSFRKKVTIGMTTPETVLAKYQGSIIISNPPIILRPFRDKKIEGILINQDMILDVQKTSRKTVNPFVLKGYLGTEIMIRSLKTAGMIFTVEDIKGWNYMPGPITEITFNNEIEDYELEEGEIDIPGLHRINNPIPSITWANPQDKDSSRIYYRVEISKTNDFKRPLVFDTKRNSEAFWLSNNGINFVKIGKHGAPSGTGYTKFISPVGLEGGIWFIRLKIGNKK